MFRQSKRFGVCDYNFSGLLSREEQTETRTRLDLHLLSFATKVGWKLGVISSMIVYRFLLERSFNCLRISSNDFFEKRLKVRLLRSETLSKSSWFFRSRSFLIVDLRSSTFFCLRSSNKVMSAKNWWLDLCAWFWAVLLRLTFCSRGV